MMRRAAPLLLSILAVFAAIFVISIAGCDKATPVAPDGSILVISANPTKIALNGTSTITVIGRKPDGQPLNPGTEIRLSATNGSIPSIVMTDHSGTATATYQSNGTPGAATITAATGTGSGSGSGGTTTSEGTGTTSGSLTASVSIQVGLSAKTITVQPTPTSIPSTGGKVQLLAIVRDANGQPQAGQGVNFTTDLGTLDSRGGIITTGADGLAHDTLRVSATDLLNNTTAIHVMAQTAGSDGGLVSGSATIQVVTSRPVAHFSYTPLADKQTVQFTNQSTGSSLTYLWTFGDGSSSMDQNPLHPYTQTGPVVVQLTVTNSATGESSVTTASFSLPLSTPGSSSP
jgi:serine protease AprX